MIGRAGDGCLHHGPVARHHLPVLDIVPEPERDEGDKESEDFHHAPVSALALFLPDRVVLLEEWADIPLTDFLDKVKDQIETFVTRKITRALCQNATSRLNGT